MDLILNGELRHSAAGDANLTLLEYLRGPLALTGTKEGCASGDCGACTVLVAEPSGTLRAINACITPLGSLHNKQVFTVESLAVEGGPLHPAQRALVDCHGSQCGFCTPGFVMALTGLYHNSQRKGVQTLDRDTVCDAISGNLCRCTGYRPIIEAGTKMLHYPAAMLPVKAAPVVHAASAAVLNDGEHAFYQPHSEHELQALLATYPDAALVAGATDLGLELTQRHRQFAVLISLVAIPSLRSIGFSDGFLQIGAALPYTDLENFIAPLSRPLQQLLHRLGSRQIRNQGTVGGNIANGSPIADMPPALLAWDAEVEVVSSSGVRSWHPLATFYLGYRKTQLQAGQYLAAIRIPQASLEQPHRFFKLSKRFEDDISAVMAAVSLQLHNGNVQSIRIALGGVAATPVRAVQSEALLLGHKLSDGLIADACRQLAAELTPISDVRASSFYRKEMASSLLQRALLEMRDAVDFEVHHYPTDNQAGLYV